MKTKLVNKDIRSNYTNELLIESLPGQNDKVVIYLAKNTLPLA